MSLAISLEIQYNNNRTRTLTGVHSSKGMEYTTENELMEWCKQMIKQLTELEPIKPHKSLVLHYNHSYCNNKANQNRSSYTSETDIRSLAVAIEETHHIFKLARAYV